MTRTNEMRAALLAGVMCIAGLWTAANAQKKKMAAEPPADIPTFSMDDIARQGFFYAGGHYEGDAGKEVMCGDAYVEVLGPQAEPAPLPDRVHPWRRTDGDRLAADSRRPSRLGVLFC